MKRRDFIYKSLIAGSLISNPIFAYRGQDPFFEIGLAQWSLNKSLIFMLPVEFKFLVKITCLSL